MAKHQLMVLSNSEGKTCSMFLDSNYFRGGLNSYYSLLLLRALYLFGYSVPLMDGMRECGRFCQLFSYFADNYKACYSVVICNCYGCFAYKKLHEMVYFSH